MPRFLDLPPEIILDVSYYLEYTCDLNALAQSCRFLYNILNGDIYQRFQTDFRGPPPTCMYTGLHWVAENGKDLCVRKLMGSGISPTMFHCNGRNPLMLAAENGHTETVRIFLDCGVNASGWTGFLEEKPYMNPLNAAIECGHVAVAKLIIEYGVELEYDCRTLGDERNRPLLPLTLATMHNQTEIVEILLEHGCDPLFPLHGLDNSRNSFLVAGSSSEEILKIFLRTGLKPEFPGNGQEFLLRAVKRGNIEMANYFWELGAELNKDWGLETCFSDPMPDYDGICCQFADSLTEYQNPNMAPLLLEKIDVDKIIERKDLRAMQFVMQGAAAGGYEDLLRRLLVVDWPEKYTTDSDAWLQHLSLCLSKAVDNGLISIVQLLLENGANADGVRLSFIEEMLPVNIFPIVRAIRQENIEMVELLLENDANPNPPEMLFLNNAFGECTSKSGTSDTMLQIIQLLVDRDCLAGPRSNAQSVLTSQSVKGGEKVFDIVRCHIGAELAPENSDHQRALFNAARLGEKGIMKRFFDARLDPNIVQHSGHSLLLIAAESDQCPVETLESTVSFILDHGANIDAKNPETGMTSLLTLCSLNSSTGFLCTWSDPAEAKKRATKLLLKKGADPFIVCSANEFPLAKVARQDEPDMVKIFLEHFKQEDTPFKKIKNMIEEAMSVSPNAETRKNLCRFYWPRVYPTSPR